jgi:hypothetical protein
MMWSFDLPDLPLCQINGRKMGRMIRQEQVCPRLIELDICVHDRKLGEIGSIKSPKELESIDASRIFPCSMLSQWS